MIALLIRALVALAERLRGADARRRPGVVIGVVVLVAVLAALIALLASR